MTRLQALRHSEHAHLLSNIEKQWGHQYRHQLGAGALMPDLKLEPHVHACAFVELVELEFRPGDIIVTVLHSAVPS